MTLRILPLLLIILSSCDSSPPEQSFTTTIEVNQAPFTINDSDFTDSMIAALQQELSAHKVAKKPGNGLIKITIKTSGLEEADRMVRAARKVTTKTLRDSLLIRINFLKNELTRQNSELQFLRKSLKNRVLGKLTSLDSHPVIHTDNQFTQSAKTRLKELLQSEQSSPAINY